MCEVYSVKALRGREPALFPAGPPCCRQPCRTHSPVSSHTVVGVAGERGWVAGERVDIANEAVLALKGRLARNVDNGEISAGLILLIGSFCRGSRREVNPNAGFRLRLRLRLRVRVRVRCKRKLYFM